MVVGVALGGGEGLSIIRLLLVVMVIILRRVHGIAFHLYILFNLLRVLLHILILSPHQ